MPYFLDNKNLFNLEPPNGDELRDCQLGAIWPLKSYKTNGTNEVACLISMPTGSGKTAIMMAACFELGLSKILIVVPSKILRRQIGFRISEVSDKKRANHNVYELAIPMFERSNGSIEIWGT